MRSSPLTFRSGGARCCGQQRLVKAGESKRASQRAILCSDAGEPTRESQRQPESRRETGRAREQPLLLRQLRTPARERERAREHLLHRRGRKRREESARGSQRAGGLTQVFESYMMTEPAGAHICVDPSGSQPPMPSSAGSVEKRSFISACGGWLRTKPELLPSGVRWKYVAPCAYTQPRMVSQTEHKAQRNTAQGHPLFARSGKRAASTAERGCGCAVCAARCPRGTRRNRCCTGCRGRCAPRTCCRCTENLCGNRGLRRRTVESSAEGLCKRTSASRRPA